MNTVSSITQPRKKTLGEKLGSFFSDAKTTVGNTVTGVVDATKSAVGAAGDAANRHALSGALRTTTSLTANC